MSSQDQVLGYDGKSYLSDQATIWRWRTAFQHEFAARMDWTLREYADANHPPMVSVNGSAGTAPVYIETAVGKPVTLDASAARDPDGHRLQFRWFHYGEAGFVPGRALARVSLSGTNAPQTTVTVTEACRPAWHPSREPCPPSSAHIILEVTDNGTPALTSYRRVILNVAAGR